MYHILIDAVWQSALFSSLPKSWPHDSKTAWTTAHTVVDERMCTTVRKHYHECSECPLLHVFKHALVVGHLGCPSYGLVRIRTPSQVGSEVRVSDSFHILSCAVVRSGFRDTPFHCAYILTLIWHPSINMFIQLGRYVGEKKGVTRKFYKRQYHKISNG